MFSIIRKIWIFRHWIHLVAISDEEGIVDAFYLIRKRLVQETYACVTFIYLVSDKSREILFKREFSILRIRYPGYFFIHFIRIDPDTFLFKHEIIEAVINSNTSPKLKFMIFGHSAFVTYMSDILFFLTGKLSENDIQQFKK